MNLSLNEKPFKSIELYIFTNVISSQLSSQELQQTCLHHAEQSQLKRVN
jgi:hypothetical protein